MIKEIYACDLSNDEIWRTNRRTIIALIQREHRCNESDAIQMLNNSTIDTPLKLENIEVWSE